jgi:hypothetical protein
MWMMMMMMMCSAPSDGECDAAMQQQHDTWGTASKGAALMMDHMSEGPSCAEWHSL